MLRSGDVVNFDLGNSLAVLERTPQVLEALLSGLPDVWTTGNEGTDTWNPFDVVGHLIDGELTDWMARLQITRVMAKQYREAVGPWQAYLPVLHR
jgi:hypothetical protein